MWPAWRCASPCDDLIIAHPSSSTQRDLNLGVTEGKGGWEFPPTLGKNGSMTRKDMPRDNSCLYHRSVCCLVTDCESHTPLWVQYCVRLQEGRERCALLSVLFALTM